MALRAAVIDSTGTHYRPWLQQKKGFNRAASAGSVVGVQKEPETNYLPTAAPFPGP